MIRRTSADVILQALLAAGVEHLFACRAEGANADTIEAAGHETSVQLAHTEAASAFMAAAQAEITWKPGACIAASPPRDQARLR